MAFATIDMTKGITGVTPTANLPTIPVTKGGTNLTSGTTDQFLKFTGTTTLASAADNAGAMTYIGGSQGTTAVPTINVNGCFSDTYVAYYCLFSGAATTTSSSSPIVKFLDSGNSVLNGSNYKYAGYEMTGGSGGAGAYFYHDAAGFMPFHTSAMGNSSNLPWDIHMWFSDVSDSGHKPVISWLAAGFFHGYSFGTTSGGGGYDVETAVAGLQMSMGGGDIREYNVRVWGRKA